MTNVSVRSTVRRLHSGERDEGDYVCLPEAGFPAFNVAIAAASFVGASQITKPTNLQAKALELLGLFPINGKSLLPISPVASAI